MYRFIRTARTRNAANVPAALQFSAQVTEHLNNTYGLNMKARMEFFGKGRVHWHSEVASIAALLQVRSAGLRRPADADAPAQGGRHISGGA